jgi:hypothetical protein
VQTLLGVVTGTKPDKWGEPIAWVRPLIDTADWREADPNEFPKRGFLFWPQANDAVRDGLVFVRARENTVRLPDIKDDFMVAEPHPALEVLDLRHIGKSEQVRVALSTGIRLPASPLPRMLIWCSDHTVVGPVGLVVGPTGTTLEKNNRHRIACFHLEEGEIRPVSYDGLTRHVVAKNNLGSPDGFVDWDDDKQVVRRALEFAVESAKKSGAVFARTKQLVEEAAEQLTRSGSPAELQLDLYRLERARPLIKRIQKSDGIATEVVSALREHPVIAKELEELKAKERLDARAEAEAALEGEREELSRLKKERAAAEATLSETTKAAREAETEAMRKGSEIEEQVRARIADVMSSAPTLLAQVSLLRPFLGGRASSIPEAPSAASYAPWKLGQAPLSAIKDLRARILPVMKALGIPPQTWQRVHSAFAARLLPLLAGPRSLDALRAYAQVATGGRMVVVQVTTALTEESDIFGRIDSARRRFVPHPAGLIDVVSAARQSDGLMLVVLDGANRGATESYLLPLVRSALRRSAPLALFHPAAVAASDPYRAQTRVDWPGNLLLAATLVEGPTTLPVAPDVWADSILIQTDADEVSAAYPLGKVPTDLSEIDPKSNLLTLENGSDATTSDWIEDIVKSNAAREVARRFDWAFRAIQNDPAALQREVVNAVLVPFLASIQDDEERAAVTAEAKKALGPKGAVGLPEAVVRARRKIA